MLTGEFFNKWLSNTNKNKNTNSKAIAYKVIDTDTNKGNINNTNAITYTSPYSKAFEKVFAKTRKIIICRILFMAFLIFTAFTLATSFPHFTSEFHMEQDKKMPVQKHDHDNEEILRVHIMAHDNSPQEQALKEQVRDEFLALTEHYRYFECRDALLDNLEKDIGELEAKLNDKIKVMSNNNEKKWEDSPNETGVYNRSAEVKLTEKNFPLRHYGEHIFPPGEYQALVVNIGKAKGQNWWCLLYPPLCLPMAETPDQSNSSSKSIPDESDAPESPFTPEQSHIPESTDSTTDSSQASDSAEVKNQPSLGEKSLGEEEQAQEVKFWFWEWLKTLLEKNLLEK